MAHNVFHVDPEKFLILEALSASFACLVGLSATHEAVEFLS